MPVSRLIALLGAVLSLQAIAAETQVEQFSPQGEVKGVRQLSVRFSDAMVALGDLRLAEPFDIDCAEKGTARWADHKNWAFDFSRDLPAGVRCSFALKSGIKDAAGVTLAGTREFSFTTGGPAILQSYPYEGSQIDEEQIFILGLDAQAASDSVLSHAYCDVQGVTERVGVRLITGEERRALLNSRKDFVDRWLRVLFEDGGERVISGRVLPRGSRADTLLTSDNADVLPIALLQCARKFPNAAKVQLVWGKGIASASGVAASADQALAFAVREAFSAKFSCERVNKDADCLPMLPMTLYFSAPVSRALAEKITLKTAAGKAYKTIVAGEGREGATPPEWVSGVSFEAPLPERAALVIDLPVDFRDDAGRELANRKRFPLQVKTDESPPLAKFPARFGIIELKGDATLPVTLRNLENLIDARLARVGPRDEDDVAGKAADKASQALNWLKNKLEQSRAHDDTPIPASVARISDSDVMDVVGWMKRLRQTEYGADVRPGEVSVFRGDEKLKRLSVPKPEGARAFEVVGIALKKPGFYVVELASPRLGAALHGMRKPYYVQTAALVTNLAVHYKWGRDSSLVWVTSLDQGAPVPNARVAIQDCGGKVHYGGQTDARGILRVPQALPPREKLPACLTSHDRQYLVTARLADDLSFVFSEWDEGIARWRFNLRGADYNGPFIAATVFDRTLARAGETINMKHYYRRHTGKGFAFLPAESLPQKAVLKHLGSDEQYEVPLSWLPNDTAESSWKIPEGAKRGSYQVWMQDSLERPQSMRAAGSFRVEEFRVPLMQATIKPVKPLLVNATSVEVDLQVRYLSGGGAAYMPVKVRAMVQPSSASFPDFEGVAFANGQVKEGIEKSDQGPWYSDEYLFEEGGEGADEDANASPGTHPLKTVTLALDGAGAGRATLPGLPVTGAPQALVAEVEYSDPNGEILTSSSRTTLWPSRVLLGVKPDAWAASKDLLKFQAIAVDVAGKPVKGQKIKVDILARTSFAHRKRLLGGFYGYESGAEVKRLATACEGTSDARGRVFCEVKPPASGNLILQAETKDAAGNSALANASVWVVGKDEWWFDATNDDRIDVIPEKKRYEPGETAQLQVRMPFREATALVTVEREGVIESSVQKLSGKLPVIKVPIKGHYAPNMFVSVLVVRGRVNDVQPTALVDLGRPAFKMGVTEIAVGWKAHELAVKVKPERASYKTRDKVSVAISVTRRDGSKPVKGTEVAIAAVDEGLLELGPNDSWKLLESMMLARGIEVDTATAAMQVVGKRHYGRKALPAGGGGGHKTSRELFDTLLFWKARVALDDKGRATVQIPLNDSLTSFRIVAVANAEAGLFGTGQASIRVSQDLIVQSGLPQLVREGDRFKAVFTVRNTSERPMNADVGAKFDGTSLPPQQLSLNAGAAAEVAWEVAVPAIRSALEWEVSAADGAASDRLKIKQRVVEAVPVRTLQATLLQLDGKFQTDVAIPSDAVPGRGGIHLLLRDRLGDELGGVREFMGRYPYTCLEQRVSKAIALRDESQWKAVMADLPSYLDRDGLAKYFSLQHEGSDVLSAYVLALAHEAGWAVPEAAGSRMRAALKRFVQGRIVRDSALPTADLSIRKIGALDALSRAAPVEPALLDSIAIEPNLWPTSAVLDWHGVLRRSEALPERNARLAAAEQIIRSRLNFQGTTMGFSTERSDYLWWLMISGDVNATHALLEMMDNDKWREDIPRMVRGALGRQHAGHWNTTVANAWGVLAMEKFSTLFEKVPVTGITLAALGGERKQLEWKQDVKGGNMTLPWPASKEAIDVQHQGSGKPWLSIQSRAAVPLKTPLFSGFKVNKSVTLIEAKDATADRSKLHRGDVVRVRLELEAQSDMTWVVVNDPLPAGSSILGGGMAKSSQILKQGEVKVGQVWPAFEERSFEAFRAYYRFVPKGQWTVEYTLRLNNAGTFELPVTRVEAMYSPEMFGEIPNAAIAVDP